MTRPYVTATDMRRSWLIQRLTKPRGGSTIFGPDNPFAFGGGLRNGGLSDEAMGLLRGIFGFDYMGSAEFEFGAVPEALNGLATDSKQLIGFVLSIPLSTVPPSWREKNAKAPDGAKDVFVICRHDQANEVTRRIEGFATKEFSDTKERVGLTSALRPYNDWDEDVQGWLELNNGYLFFTDQTMYEQTAALFGVTTARGSSS